MGNEADQSQHQEGQATAQTENAPQQEAPQQTIPTTISSLENYRRRQESKQQGRQGVGVASALTTEQGQTEGQSEPNVGESQGEPQDNREQWIPRDRFDQVITQKQQLEQQVQAAQQYLQQYQQQGPPQQQFQPQPQPQVGPTGMVQNANLPQQQPAQQQQTRQNPDIPNFDDPEVQKEWKRKINNDPIGGMREFMRYIVQAEGTPLLEQYVQQINSQLTPLQRAFVSQQAQQYAQNKANDPQFSQVRPVFDQLVQTASQRGYDISNPQVLSTIEFVARQQAGVPNQGQTQQPPQPVPFSERPGNSGQGAGRSQQQTRQLTPQEQRIAQRFGQTPQQYLDSLRAMGVE